MIQRKRRDFKKGVRGLAPPIVLSGQPSALLALLTAGNRCNPYLDTVGNGSALGKPGIYDPQLDPKPLKPTLIFWILTPCEKPVATGSAGRCEPGVGRFTDPHPLTCSFFTSPFCWLMFWLCALPSALSKSVLLVEENSAFHRAQSHASIRCPCRPSWACFFLSALS